MTKLRGVETRTEEPRCGHCRALLVYAGTGRRPRYCSASCRTRAWEARRYGAGAGGATNRPGAEATDTVLPPPPAPETAGPAVATTARQWAVLLDTLAVELVGGPVGRAHYDHRHLHAALLRVWGALDAAHPGGLDALERRR
ncbi:hypothetical protein [Frankia sp. Cas3]|uniref:hypothetical protein n=1 Tax=Frankia sp. Cas3 TaxID=3073926 RepID=UPI002AD24A63|nr:hypothetical protein [Frankia sp. Cas3]